MSLQLKAGGCGSRSDLFPNSCVSLWEAVLGGLTGKDAMASSVSIDLRGSRSGGRAAGFAPCAVAFHGSSLPVLPLPIPPVEEVDNTVTLIILAVVGGVIGLLVCILLLKKLITFILKKTREKK